MKRLFVFATGLCLASFVNAQTPESIEEIVVTGSFIKRTQQSDVASPIDVVDLDDLSAEASFNASDIILNLTTNSGAQNQSDGFNQTNSIGTTNVNLRGLGVSSTLTLLNGRRQTLSAATTLSGDQFIDLNSLVPTIAINQVEVLKDGATSLYGSDAVAGIVNFKTRKDFEGVEVGVNYVTTTENSQEDAQISVIAGRNFGKIHAVFSASFFDRSSLSAEARRDEFQLRDANSIFGQPGTYLVFPSQPGPPVRTLDPQCEAIAADDDDIGVITAIPPLNPTCSFDFGDFFSLVAEEQRFQGYLDLTANIADSSEWFLEFGYTENKVLSTGSPSQPILFPPIVPENNPATQALGGGRLLAFHRVDGAGAPASKTNFDYSTYRIATGLRGEFSNKWNYEFAVTNSQNDFDYLNTSDTLRDRYLAALGGTGGPNNNEFFNPLFGATNDPAVREDFRGVYSWAAKSSLITIDGFVAGEIAQLPAGAVGLVVGAQYRKDTLSYTYSKAANDDNLYFFIGNRDFDDEQEVYAIFTEVDVPLAESFGLQAAIRYEDFGTDNSVDPKIGFLWRPLNTLSLRGTFGTSFRTPSIFQGIGRFNVPARVRDPNNNNDLSTVAQQTSADPDNPVKSQKSETLNFGATWVSNDESWRVSVDYWNFDYKDFITPENATALVAAAPNGPQVTRATDETDSALIAVSTFFRNAGSLKTDGLDFSISKNIETNALGSLNFQLNLTYVLSYGLEDPVSGKIDGLGQRNFTNFGVPMPELRGTFGVGWSKASHSISAYLRYTDSYADENNEGAKIDSFVSTDLQYSWDGSFGRDSGLIISAGAKNLFDKMPPDVVSRTGYDALTHNPRGRQIYLSARFAF